MKRLFLLAIAATFLLTGCFRPLMVPYEKWEGAEHSAAPPSPPPTGNNTKLDTSNFDNNLSGSDTTVQAALETLDETAGGTGAPTDVDYWVGTADAGLSAEQVVNSAATLETAANLGAYASDLLGAADAAAVRTLLNVEDGADVTDATNVSTAGAPIISSGAGAPSSTPSKVGDVYIDTTNDDAYHAVGTADSGDWEKSNDGAGSGTPATADISDVSVTQTELAELETIGDTTISAAQWAGLGGATTAGIALWDDADAPAQLITLGLTATASEINTPLDGASVTLTEFQELETIGATTISAAQWAGLGGATTAGINLWDDADASAQRTTLGVAIGSDVQAYSALLANLAANSGAVDISGTTLTLPPWGSAGSVFEGSTADEFETSLVVTDPTADRTITFPNDTGTVPLLGTAQTFSAKQTFTGGADIGDGGDQIQVHGVAAGANDGYYDGWVRSFTVDSGQSNTSFGQAYHVDTDGELIEADGDVASQGAMPAIGLAVEAGTGSKKILLRGLICETDWAWTVGGPVYVSDDPTTTEGLTQTAISTSGDTVQLVGIATSADCIEVTMGGLNWVEVP